MSRHVRKVPLADVSWVSPLKTTRTLAGSLHFVGDACRDNRTAQRVGSMWTGLVERIEHRQNIPEFFRILVQIVECIEKRKVFGA
jgi:hypothetical protein